MKLFFTILFIVTFITSFASPKDLFSYNEKKIQTEFKELSILENILIDNNFSKNIIPLNNNLQFNQCNLIYEQLSLAPGNIPSFWFTFFISAIGTYTLYGAGAGFIAAGIVYVITDADRSEVRKATWGCITGLLVGGGVKYLILNLKARP